MRALALTLACLIAVATRADDPRIVVALTFDLDAETVWWSDPDTMTGHPSSLSQGRYGPTVALPKILAVLDRHDIRATFFIPAWVATNYPDAVRSIAAAGHEIGAHGVRHVSPALLSPEEERREFAESVQTLERFAGVRPTGYRAPSWALSKVTLELAAAAGFMYSSNLSDADAPYVHGTPPGLVELPVSWVLDDAPYFWFDEDSWNKKIHSAADVKAIWQEEFTAAYDAGGYFNLTMHPQIIGRPARLAMLDELITWMKAQPGVTFETGAAIAAQTDGDRGKH
ncbi:MAG: polysaccharide deacetylase [Gammaproteobacteria bacterium]|nr:polysaccharide deacetylase [Gammaproteobacteria bacterium]MDH5344425.1 polysaccharide deacetylase [Gammaproteobacteria bacterium]